MSEVKLKVFADLQNQLKPKATIRLLIRQELVVGCKAADMDEVIESALNPGLELSDDSLGLHRISLTVMCESEKLRGKIGIMRTLETTIDFKSEKKLVKGLSVLDENILDLKTRNFDGLLFANFFLNSWNEVWLKGASCSFDSKLESGELKLGDRVIPSNHTRVMIRKDGIRLANCVCGVLNISRQEYNTLLLEI